MAAARRRQQRLGERVSTVLSTAGDALGASSPGSGGIVGAQRLSRFCCCCTHVQWQRAAGRCAGWLAMAAHRGAARSGARLHVLCGASRRSVRLGASMGGTYRVHVHATCAGPIIIDHSSSNSNNKYSIIALPPLLSVVSSAVITSKQTSA